MRIRIASKGRVANAFAAGDVVTTGTWTGMTPVTFGDEVVARFAGIGEAALRISG